MKNSVAIIQNISEMLRYGYADIRPSLKGMTFDFHHFINSNIEDIFGGMRSGQFDSIVFSTNTFNDELIMNAFLNHKEDVANFLNEQHGGILILFQKRLTESRFKSYGFLPEGYDLVGKMKPETTTDGSLGLSNLGSAHVVLQYPHVIDLNSVEYHALHNERFRGLYRGFTEPSSDGKYINLIEDQGHKDTRPLLLCSRADIPGRVISTGLFLDWQGHYDLLENCVVFITRGYPNFALVKREGLDSFDFDYLAANLDTHKLHYQIYSQKQLNFSERMFNLHNTIVLEPTWEYSDIVKSNLRIHQAKLLSDKRVIYFSNHEGVAPTVCHIGGIRELDALIENTMAWLKSQFSKGSWGNSFWRTYDVVNLFRYLDEPLDSYWDEMLAQIYPHDINGSYDESFGATCALLPMYAWGLGTHHDKYKTTLNWLKNALKNQSLFFEIGAAIDVLNLLGEKVERELVNSYLSQVMPIYQDINSEIELSRYIKVLLSSGFYEDSAKIALHLCKFQGNDGNWVNIHQTAEVVLTLINLQAKLSNPKSELNDAIYKGIVYIKRFYDPDSSSWQQDSALTAKALYAIVEFEKKMSYPIDEVVSHLAKGEHYTKIAIAVDASKQLNIILQRKITELEKNAETEFVQKHYAANVAMVASLVSATLLAFFVLILLYNMVNGLSQQTLDYLMLFTKGWIAVIFGFIALALFGGLYAILKYNELLVRWLFRKKNNINSRPNNKTE